jgi:folate-dependent phosphoribosylglycinamide formyltransferase PurN
MSLSGINSRLSNIESRLSAMGGASAPAAVDNSEEVAKLGEKITLVEKKADAGLNACNQVIVSNKKDAETLLQRILKLENVVEKLVKSFEGLSKKQKEPEAQV